jgi:2-polyprenyl-3-methyl-5-hydroxy-6-metoxy-1,4-benzoquinol methylase
MLHYHLKSDPLSSHQQVAKLVRALNREPILDVGSAQGMLGQLLQGSALEVDAVEPNPEWAEAAKPLYRHTYQGMIESVQLPRKHYQVVVCADVLEHTVDPVAVLRQLRTCATDDAIFIVSLPNIAHVSVRLLLLFGYFPKMSRGLLDRTHLHFYTRDTAVHMLASAGLKVQQFKATVAPLSEIWPEGDGNLFVRMLWHLQHIAAPLSRGLFAYQWILMAQATAMAPQASSTNPALEPPQGESGTRQPPPEPAQGVTADSSQA